MKVDLFKVLQKLMAVHNVAVSKYEYPYNFENVDLSFRKSFDPEFNMNSFLKNFSVGFIQGKLYIIEDMFGVFYTAFIRKAKHPTIIVVGPYTYTGEFFNESKYLEKGFTKKEVSLIKENILRVPHIHEDVITHQVAAVLSAAEDAEIEIKNISEHRAKNKNDNKFSLVYLQNSEKSSMDKIEQRYNAENEILQAVAMGNLTKARKAFGKIVDSDVEERYQPHGARKKSLITMNTLFRKAIEQAGVHPFYLDEISYRFFQKIDLVSDRRDQIRLLDEMLTEYCEYAKKYSVEQYSPIVQKAINFIHLNLATTISLKEIAEILEITPNHLARVFKMETGETVVEYINHTRVKIAANRLKQTSLTVAEIAGNVGITDTNYFSRIFRKCMGCSPTEYRR